MHDLTVYYFVDSKSLLFIIIIFLIELIIFSLVSHGTEFYIIMLTFINDEQYGSVFYIYVVDLYCFEFTLSYKQLNSFIQSDRFFTL